MAAAQPPRRPVDLELVEAGAYALEAAGAVEAYETPSTVLVSLMLSRRCRRLVVVAESWGGIDKMGLELGERRAGGGVALEDMDGVVGRGMILPVRRLKPRERVVY
ncbi:hypothetical protein MIND_00407900 [Mycena indigotica]|uniref:Uncharacterized protein n=1 Tax=Mycena indigotica TaxID=2126181 RepID=A0A8H6WD18_9AGAR|nr:uncharacterized protein MIND_00407900 [Mycena indigotica]KAF7310338.1 hypothetical protein MIND_00407900 [Mycena indigotica]